MVKFAAQGSGYGGDIAFDHLKREAVAGGIAAREIGITGLQFQPGLHQPRHARSKAEAGGPCPAAKVQHTLARAGIHAGGKQHGVCGGAVAVPGLPQVQPPAQKGVMAKVGVGKHLFARINFTIAQHGGGDEIIGIAHHQAAGQNTDGAIEYAHVDVHFEHLYIFSLQHGFGEGDDRGVGCAQNLFHRPWLWGSDA